MMDHLLTQKCAIWGVVSANPEQEFSQDTEQVVFSNIPCRLDTIMFRRAAETVSGAGAQGIKRGTFYIQDPRLVYGSNFSEDNWIVHNGQEWEILTIHVTDSPLTGAAHYEIDVQAGRNR